MKKRLILVSSAILAMTSLVSCQPQQKEIKSEDDKTLYTVGAMFGSRLKQMNLNDDELQSIARGISDSAQGKKLVVDLAAYQPKVQKLFKDRMTAGLGDEKKKGTEFLNKFAKEQGVQKTSSGLAYKVLKAGTGRTPKADDIVEVHYHGTLIDGTVFDSSVERKKTVTFPLTKVIKGWTEGLQHVKEGGKIKLVIPPGLAYGDHGAPPKIPGGSTLVFEVELFKIVEKQAKAAPKKSKTAKKK